VETLWTEHKKALETESHRVKRALNPIGRGRVLEIQQTAGEILRGEKNKGGRRSMHCHCAEWSLHECGSGGQHNPTSYPKQHSGRGAGMRKRE